MQGLDLGTLSPNPIRRDHKPFLKRLERKLLLNLKRHDGVIANLLRKGLIENPGNV
ncbi:MAG TPA: hypothetical protein VN414_03680 [Methanosarcina sp.]|nr:hypothetical protein [Methanosarcina sp.]